MIKHIKFAVKSTILALQVVMQYLLIWITSLLLHAGYVQWAEFGREVDPAFYYIVFVIWLTNILSRILAIYDYGLRGLYMVSGELKLENEEPPNGLILTGDKDLKAYIVSIHSHRGSMTEASGKHHIVTMTNDEYNSLYKEYHGEEIASEKIVLITPITTSIGYKEIFNIIRTIEVDAEEEL